MRRRDGFGNNRDQENYSGLTGYDEMSTRQVDEQTQKQNFGFTETVAPPQSQIQNLYTRPPQSERTNDFIQQSMFGGTPQNNGYGQNNNFAGASQNNGYAPQNSYAQQNDYTQQSNGYKQNSGDDFAAPTGYVQPSGGQSYASDNYTQFGGAEERPMVFKVDKDPNGYIYEYSDRLEYYRYTGAGMLLINSVSKKR